MTLLLLKTIIVIPSSLSIGIHQVLSPSELASGDKHGQNCDRWGPVPPPFSLLLSRLPDLTIIHYRDRFHGHATAHQDFSEYISCSINSRGIVTCLIRIIAMTSPSLRGRLFQRSSSSGKLSSDDDGEDSKWPRDRRSRHSSDSEASAHHRSLATSVTAFFSKLRPSRRPKRGFSTRHPNTWRGDCSQTALATLSSQDMTSGATGKRRLSIGELDEASDTIPPEYWNTPIAIPRRTHSLNNRIPRKPVPISATRQIPNTNTACNISPRGSLANTGLTLDGAALFPARKPLHNTLLARASSVPATKASTQAADRARELFLAKQEARRQRRNLKESGDFLGVTGFNPHTGELDIMTPTTSSEEGMSPETPYLTELAQKAQEAQKAYNQAKKEIRAKKNKEKTDKKEKQKETLRVDQHRIKWRREEGQWSSVAEPRLSPIPQSRRNSVTTHSSDSTTIRHEPASFLGTGAAPVLTLAARSRQSSSESTEAQKAPSQQPTVPVPPLDNQEHICHTDRPNESSVTATSSPRRRRTMRLSIPPIIPRRLGPFQRDTNPPTPPTGPRTAPPGPAPELELENQNPADRWAKTLMQDLDGLERSIEANSREMKAWAGSLVQNINGLGEAVRSAYTPTTTITTGCAQILRPHDVYAEKEGTLQDIPPKATASPLLKTSRNNGVCLAPLDFPPPMQPSAWLSLPNLPLQTARELPSGCRVVEIPETAEPSQPPSMRPSFPSIALRDDTTLDRPHTPTIVMERKFLPVWTTDDKLQREMRKTMRPTGREEQWQDINIISPPTSMSTFPSSLLINSATTKSRARKEVHKGESELLLLNQAMAHRAARQAFGDHVPPTISGQGPVSDPESNKLAHGALGAVIDTGGGAGTQASPRRGGVRGEAKTVMGAEAGLDGKPDLAGTVSWGPLVPLRVTSAKGDFLDEKMAIRALPQPQMRHERNCDKQQQKPLPPLFIKQLELELIPVRLRKATSLARQLVSAYWRLVRPAFDPESPLRQRLGQKEATGQDYGICMLALVFLVLAGAAGVWAIRTMVGAACLIGLLIRGILVLAGFF